MILDPFRTGDTALMMQQSMQVYTDIFPSLIPLNDSRYPVYAENALEPWCFPRTALRDRKGKGPWGRCASGQGMPFLCLPAALRGMEEGRGHISPWDPGEPWGTTLVLKHKEVA